MSKVRLDLTDRYHVIDIETEQVKRTYRVERYGVSYVDRHMGEGMGLLDTKTNCVYTSSIVDASELSKEPIAPDVEEYIPASEVATTDTIKEEEPVEEVVENVSENIVETAEEPVTEEVVENNDEKPAVPKYKAPEPLFNESDIEEDIEEPKSELVSFIDRFIEAVYNVSVKIKEAFKKR